MTNSSNEQSRQTTIRKVKKNEVFIAAAPGVGHMGPNITLASYLLAQPGISVTLLLPLAFDTPTPTATPPPSEFFRVVRIRVPGDVKENMAARDAVDDARDQIVTDLINTCCLVESPPTVVIYDMFAVCWATLLAETLNIPHFTFFPSPLTFAWFAQHWADIGERRDTVRDALNEDDKTPAGMRMPPPMIGDVDVYIPGIRNAIKGSDMVDGPPTIVNRITGYFKLFHRSEGAIIHDLAALYPRPIPLMEDIKNHFNEEAKEAGLNKERPYELFCTGPLVLYDHRLSKSLTESCPELDWLDKQEPRSVIFVALGSWCQMNLADTVELARGLQQSGLKFLWAYRDRQESSYLQERKCVESTAESGLPTNFEKDIEGFGTIQKWVNQPAVLRHPALSCFVSHCGWNSTMESLALAGVPIALLPIGAEQGVNANVLEQDWKCGKRLWDMRYDRQLERSRVAEVVRECATDETLRAKAKELKNILNDAFDGTGRAERSRFCDLICEQ